MQRFMLKSKIHRATVTDADLHYEGSISIDEQLMGAADLLPYEKVAIYDVSNGERFETYVIPAPRDSGTISNKPLKPFSDSGINPRSRCNRNRGWEY